MTNAASRLQREAKDDESKGYASLFDKELNELEVWSHQVKQDLSLFGTSVELDDSSDEEYENDYQYPFTEDIDDIKCVSLSFTKEYDIVFLKIFK